MSRSTTSFDNESVNSRRTSFMPSGGRQRKSFGWFKSASETVLPLGGSSDGQRSNHESSPVAPRTKPSSETLYREAVAGGASGAMRSNGDLHQPYPSYAQGQTQSRTSFVSAPPAMMRKGSSNGSQFGQLPPAVVATPPPSAPAELAPVPGDSSAAHSSQGQLAPGPPSPRKRPMSSAKHSACSGPTPPLTPPLDSEERDTMPMQQPQPTVLEGRQALRQRSKASLKQAQPRAELVANLDSPPTPPESSPELSMENARMPPPPVPSAPTGLRGAAPLRAPPSTDASSRASSRPQSRQLEQIDQPAPPPASEKPSSRPSSTMAPSARSRPVSLAAFNEVPMNNGMTPPASPSPRGPLPSVPQAMPSQMPPQPQQQQRPVIQTQPPQMSYAPAMAPLHVPVGMHEPMQSSATPTTPQSPAFLERDPAVNGNGYHHGNGHPQAAPHVPFGGSSKPSLPPGAAPPQARPRRSSMGGRLFKRKNSSEEPGTTLMASLPKSESSFFARLLGNGKGANGSSVSSSTSSSRPSSTTGTKTSTPASEKRKTGFFGTPKSSTKSNEWTNSDKRAGARTNGKELPPQPMPTSPMPGSVRRN